MKNITLSIPDELLQKSRAYAKRHHTTLNDLVRRLLQENVERNTADLVGTLLLEMDKIHIQHSALWKREDLYER